MRNKKINTIILTVFVFLSIFFLTACQPIPPMMIPTEILHLYVFGNEYKTITGADAVAAYDYSAPLGDNIVLENWYSDAECTQAYRLNGAELTLYAKAILIEDNLYFEYDANKKGFFAAGPYLNAETYTIPATVYNGGTVKGIAEKAFYGHPNLKEITMKVETNYTIGEEAFRECEQLETVTVLETDKQNRFIPYLEIGDESFCQCLALTAVRSPYPIQFVGISAFSECGKLSELPRFADYADLAAWAFSGCSSLTEIKGGKYFLNGVIPDGLFSYCSSLERLPEIKNICFIGSNSFANCGIQPEEAWFYDR